MPPPRWLLVVRRDRPRLYANLRESLADQPEVEVILDRRQGEDGRPAGHPERRAAWGPRERDQWETLGFRLVYRGEDLRVYERPVHEVGPQAGTLGPDG